MPDDAVAELRRISAEMQAAVAETLARPAQTPAERRAAVLEALTRWWSDECRANPPIRVVGTQTAPDGTLTVTLGANTPMGERMLREARRAAAQLEGDTNAV